MQRVGGGFFLFLGKHSMNLWLIHSFFIYYYAKNVTFLTHNPTIMFFTILVISLGCSIIVEFLKKTNMILKSINWIRLIIVLCFGGIKLIKNL